MRTEFFNHWSGFFCNDNSINNYGYVLGSGAAFMRIGVIGSASYELMLAGIAADVLGIELKSANITTGVFSFLSSYAMILGSAPYFINCFLV